MDKRKRELAKAIKPHGYRIAGVSGTNHYLIRNKKTGHELTCSTSPSSIKNWIRAVLRDIDAFGGG